MYFDFDDIDDVLNESDTEEGHPLIVPATRTRFYNSIHQQNFPFRAPIIDYVAKNPFSHAGHFKLIQACKFFFIKNPIILVSMIHNNMSGEKWFITVNGEHIDINDISSNVWITDEIEISSLSSTWQNEQPREAPYISSIMPKIYKSDIEQFILWHHNIFLDDLIFLASKCKLVSFSRVTVENKDGSKVALEKIIEALPKVDDFYYFAPNDADKNIFTSKTIEDITKIPQFKNLTSLVFQGLPDIFDINQFYDYIKKNKKTKIKLEFRNQISFDYQNRLQEIVDEIIEAEYHDYRIPMINFPDIDGESYKKLFELFK
uniref:Uncharacterized protein n=1 Tax=Panagrolaimus davidi TaxID=227884 RepID=A0A914QXJ1_9BILA